MAVEERPVPRFTRSAIEYLDFGAGPEGTVVFAHGFRDSAQGWVPVGRELGTHGYRVLAVQRRAAPARVADSGQLLEIYAEQVLDVVEAATSAGERVVVAGQSMGAAVAELAAVRLGSRLQRLVLITPAPLGGTPLPSEVLTTFQAAAQVTDPEAVGTGKFNMCVNTDADTQRRLVMSTPLENPAAILQSLSSWVGGHEAGRRPSPVAVPTLLVTTDDQFFTEDTLCRQVAPRFEQIRVEAVHGAGHYPHLERPVELAELIARFLSASTPETTVETRTPFEEQVVTPTASGGLDEVFQELTSWFFDQYFPRWVSVGNGTSAEGPEFILQFWGCPLHVSAPQITMWITEPQGVLDLLEMNQKPLRDAGYTHTVIADSRVTVFHSNGAAIDAIWSRRATDDTEIQRAAVHFELARSVDGWRVVGIQTSDTTMSALDRLWPPHRLDYGGSPQREERCRA
jgi:pimeloyl-ACP methyl ester carboxylesterase